MTIRELIDLLKTFPSDSADIIIRDLNGLDWLAEPSNFKVDYGHDLLIDTKNINVID